MLEIRTLTVSVRNYVMLCYLRYVTLRNVMLCYVTLCFFMLCYAMLAGAIIGDGDRKRAPFLVLGLAP